MQQQYQTINIAKGRVWNLDSVSHDNNQEGYCCKTPRQASIALFITLLLFVVLAIDPAHQRTSSSRSYDAPRTGEYIQQPLMIDLQDKLKGKILFPWELGFADARRTWNDAINRRPLAVVVPDDESDVVETVKFMNMFPKTEFRIKSGGHSYAAYSTAAGSVVLSMSKINQIDVSDLVSHGVVRIGAGALIQDVVDTLAPLGFAVITGVCGTVGMGGFVQGGGFGYLSNKHGLASDTAKSFQVVLADGSLVTCDEKSHPDLFWALRGGGGGNFGVVTQITMQAFHVPAGNRQLYGSAIVSMEQATDFFIALSQQHSSLPKEMLIFMEGGLMSDPDNLQVFLTWVGEDEASLQRGRDAFTTVIQPLLPTVEFWEQAVGNWTRSQDPGYGNFVSGFTGFLTAETATPENWRHIMFEFNRLVRENPFTLLDIEMWGGAIGKHAASGDTAFPYRDALFNVGFVLLVPRSTDYATKVFPATVAKGKATYDKVKSVYKGTYVNYIVEALSADEAVKEYYGPNLERLMNIKRKYDPTDRFRYEQSIPPVA